MTQDSFDWNRTETRAIESAAALGRMAAAASGESVDEVEYLDRWSVAEWKRRVREALREGLNGR